MLEFIKNNSIYISLGLGAISILIILKMTAIPVVELTSIITALTELYTNQLHTQTVIIHIIALCRTGDYEQVISLLNELAQVTQTNNEHLLKFIDDVKKADHAV